MVRYGSDEYFRRRHLRLMVFTGVMCVIFYPAIISHSGMLVAGAFLAGGVTMIALGLFLLLRRTTRAAPP